MGIIEGLLAQDPALPEPHGDSHHEILSKLRFEGALRMTHTPDSRGRPSLPFFTVIPATAPCAVIPATAPFAVIPATEGSPESGPSPEGQAILDALRLPG